MNHHDIEVRYVVGIVAKTSRIDKVGQNGKTA